MISLSISILPCLYSKKNFLGDFESNIFISFLKIVYLILIFLIILTASYYLSRYIAKKNLGKNKFIKIIETLSLGYDKNLYIIKIGEEFFLIACTQKEINLIDKLSSEKFNKVMLDAKNIELEKNQEFHNLNNEYNYGNIKGYHNDIKKSIKKLKNFVRGSKTND